ncbi:MAG TPA: hypothetical protein VFV99_15695 [Kofleriaceae bacterium]|nr:hypothetical protein [Kofleriaceae bacterium]
MSKAKQPSPTGKRGSRDKHVPGDSSTERQDESTPEREESSLLDDLFGESDGVVDEENELDTDKYARPVDEP